MSVLRILSYNILSPIYTAPEWYPEVELQYLDKDYRLSKILPFVASQRDKVDVFAFQEVNPPQLALLTETLGSEFVGSHSYNDPDYWLDSVIPPLTPLENGTVIFLRKSLFDCIEFKTVPLGTGNIPVEATAVHRASGKHLRLCSVHYDSDIKSRRKAELKALLASLAPGPIDIIIGDMNSSVDPSSTVGRIYQNDGFISVLEIVGETTPTHPWDQWKNDPSYNPIIDHIMIRGGAIPIKGKTFDYGITKIPDEATRISLTLKQTGSDHYAIKGSIRID